MSTPIPHKHFLVLSIINGSQEGYAVSGVIIRKEMKARRNIKQHLPNFYQMMQRMVLAKLVRHEYRPWNGEVAYGMTKTGHKALMESYGFYQYPGVANN